MPLLGSYLSMINVTCLLASPLLANSVDMYCINYPYDLDRIKQGPVTAQTVFNAR